MSGEIRSKLNKHGRAILALSCFILFLGCSVESASAFTVETDIAKLVEKLGIEPHLENFSSYTTADKEAVERGLADTEFLNKEWAGRSLADFLSHYGITSVPEGPVNVIEGELDGGVAATPDAGSVAFETGGEGLDAAATGLGVEGLGAAVGTIGVGVAAFAGGYYIGTKLVQVFGDQNIASEHESTFSFGQPIEGAVWQRIHICSFHCYESIGEATFEGGTQNQVEGEHEIHDGPTYGTVGASSPLPEGYNSPADIGKNFYLFTPRVSLLFVCSECFIDYAVGFRPKIDEGHAWPYGDPIVEQEALGCTETGEWAGKVEGWPPHIKNSGITVGEPYKDSCTPYEEVGCPFHCERRNKNEKYNHDETVAIWRSQSQMPVDFPKSGRTCHEGFTCEHTEVPEYPEMETLREHLPHAFSHGEHAELNKWIEHYQGASVPLPGLQEIPSCSSNLATECKSLLESEGFHNIEINPVTWEHAVITKPANATISVNPASGSFVETTQHIIIEANPATMPLIIPTPLENETATHYKERLEGEGQHDVSLTTRTEINTNPHVGPEGVAGISPAAGSPTNPTGETPIRVEENPPSAAAPEEENKIGPPSLPGFNIPEFKVECKGFPFGVPCWIAETVESWSSSAEAPEWGIESFTVMGHTIPGAKFHLSVLEPIMTKVRVAMLIFATIGLVLLFYRFARGGTPQSGSGISDTGTGGVPQPDDDVYL